MGAALDLKRASTRSFSAMKTNCTLSSEELSERLGWIEREISPHVRSSEKRPTGFVWELEDTPEVAAKLERWIALERECCRDVAFERGPGSQPGRIRLEMKRGDSRGKRFAKLGGLGVVGTLAACCGLPLLAATGLGGAAAVLPLGAAILWWRNRRAKPSESCCGECGPTTC